MERALVVVIFRQREPQNSGLPTQVWAREEWVLKAEKIIFNYMGLLPLNPIFHHSSSAVVAIGYYGEVSYSNIPIVSEAN